MGEYITDHGVRWDAASGSVLIVGDVSGSEHVRDLLESQGLRYQAVSSVREGMRLLRQSGGGFDLVILLPGRAIDALRELCRAAKFDQRTSHVAVVCLLPPGEQLRAVDFFDAGADDCIRGEAEPREVALRLERVMSSKRALDSLEDSNAVIHALAGAVEGKDHYTCGHVERVGDYAVQMGRRMGLDEARIQALRIGGVVHDIGKIGIPDQILNKPGKLTEEEMAIMRRHPVIGYEILKPLRTFRHVLPIVRWHHEKPNGTGYPDGLVGDDVPLTARIIAVADVFDALSTDRPYRKAYPVDKCLQILHEDAAIGNLDPAVVEVLHQILTEQQSTARPPMAA